MVPQAQKIALGANLLRSLLASQSSRSHYYFIEQEAKLLKKESMNLSFRERQRGGYNECVSMYVEDLF